MKSLGTKWKNYTKLEQINQLKKEIVYLGKVWGTESYEVISWERRLRDLRKTV